MATPNAVVATSQSFDLLERPSHDNFEILHRRDVENYEVDCSFILGLNRQQKLY
jgi:hypothetical protein